MPTKTICIVNQKGGVGKTTTAASLAHALAMKNKQVLLVDLDSQGQCASILGLAHEPGAFYLLVSAVDQSMKAETVKQYLRPTGRDGLTLLPGNQLTTMAQAMMNAQGTPISCIRESLNPFLRSGPDYVVLDTAPTLGGIQERAIWAADLVIVPTAVEAASLEGVEMTVATLKSMYAERGWKGGLLGVLPTMYDDQTRESRSAMNDLQKGFSDRLLPAIHRATVLRECFAEGQTIFEKAAGSRPAREYLALAQEVLKY